MKKNNYVFNISILSTTLFLLLYLLLSDFEYSKSWILDEFLSFGHLLLFGLFSIVLIYILNNRKWPVFHLRYYIASFLIVSLLGLITEYLQLLTSYRQFMVSDIINDILGSFIFLVIVYSFTGLSFMMRRRLRLLSSILILAASFPIHVAIIDTLLMNRDFPLLYSFESSLEMERFAHKGSVFKRINQYSTHGLYSLKLQLSPGEYPGITFNRFYQNWSRYQSFSLDVYVEGNKPLPITVRIYDKNHNFTYKDRFNGRYILLPGMSHINIDLKKVMRSPRSRNMDMGHIDNLTLFSYQLKEPRVIFIDNLRLEPAESPSGKK